MRYCWSSPKFLRCTFTCMSIVENLSNFRLVRHFPWLEHSPSLLSLGWSALPAVVIAGPPITTATGTHNNQVTRHQNWPSVYNGKPKMCRRPDVAAHTCSILVVSDLAPVSISDKTSCCKISWSLEAGLNNFFVLKFDRHHLSSSAVEVPVKFQSDWTILNTNLVASRLCEILQ